MEEVFRRGWSSRLRVQTTKVDHSEWARGLCDDEELCMQVHWSRMLCVGFVDASKVCGFV